MVAALENSQHLSITLQCLSIHLLEKSEEREGQENEEGETPPLKVQGVRSEVHVTDLS